ncbi:hypothetical protein [Microbacterium aerolatum]|uniref:hypothetical protein n=1 Tax=Microbacterium aerolatum TaxID=153731 RepID=UPI00384ED431
MDSVTTDHDWVARRVDTVAFVDGERLELKVTLDVDLESLRKRARTAGVWRRFVPVPLLTLAKGPLLDIDVRDSRGHPLAILTRDQDAHAAAAMLLALLSRNDVPLRGIPASVRDQLYSIVRETDPVALEHVAHAASPSAVPTPPSQGLVAFTATDAKVWSALMKTREFFDAVFDYADSYLMLSPIDLHQAGDVAIVKMRLLQERDPEESASSWFSLDRLGWKPQTQRIPMGGVGKAQRNHVRILAPEDSHIRNARWMQDDSLLKKVADGVYSGQPAPLDRATFYDSGLPPADYHAEVDLEPARGPFLFPAWLTTGLLLVLVGFALFFQWMDGRFSWAAPTFVIQPDDRYGLRFESVQVVQANFDAAVTVLAIIPSLVAIYIVRAGEHQLITRLMTVPRTLVLMSAFAAIICAGATAASVQRESLLVVYMVGFLIVLVAFVSVTIPLVRVSRVLSRRRKP